MTMLVITAFIGLAVEAVYLRMHNTERGGALR